jgi:hypothetical protein
MTPNTARTNLVTVPDLRLPHRCMRIIPLLLLMGTAFVPAPVWAGDEFGIWTVNPKRSTDPSPKTLIVQFEPHSKGEVFTLDKVDRDGRRSTSSTILYFDGQPREFQDFGCSGTQTSRRVDGQTVEILRNCASGEWIRFVRRLSTQPKELVLEITEQYSDGRRLERRLVLERQ